MKYLTQTFPSLFFFIFRLYRKRERENTQIIVCLVISISFLWQFRKVRRGKLCRRNARAWKTTSNSADRFESGSIGNEKRKRGTEREKEREKKETTFNLAEQYGGISEGESPVSDSGFRSGGEWFFDRKHNTEKSPKEEGKSILPAKTRQNFSNSQAGRTSTGEFFSLSLSLWVKQTRTASSDVTRQNINAPFAVSSLMYDACLREEEKLEEGWRMFGK